jgi:hypothetical protein
MQDSHWESHAERTRTKQTRKETLRHNACAEATLQPAAAIATSVPVSGAMRRESLASFRAG